MAKKRPLDATRTKKKDSSSSEDWLNDLVKKAASEDTANSAAVSSKQDRIHKRQAKKRLRQERLSEKTAGRISDREHFRTIGVGKDSSETEQRRVSDRTRHYLQRLSSEMKTLVESRVTQESARHHRPSPYQAEATSHFKKRQWEPLRIQPRRNDYGGIGLARQSLFLETDDPSFRAKLEQEFDEHIPGFFGKQRTKAMKKQLSNKMLWKQMSTKKDMKIGGKRLGDMTPDEQVEAMIKAGMI